MGAIEIVRTRRITRGAALLAVLAWSAPAQGQTLDELRDAVRNSLRDAQFASVFTSLVLLSGEFELSTGNYTVDDDDDTKISSLALPFQYTAFPWGEKKTGLYLEGVVGYTQAKQRTDDFYAGAIPGLETSISSKWTTYGALLGIGPEFQIGEELTMAPLVHLGLARIDSKANYGGPGAGVTAALLDGILFNWDGLVLSSGGATRVDWVHSLSGDRVLELIGRYDLRWTQTVTSDDVAQRFKDRAQLVTLRAELRGPTSLRPMGLPMGWRSQLAYRRFLEGDLFGARDLVQLGGQLDFGAEKYLPAGSVFTLSAAAFVGENITGWTAGAGVSF